MPQLMPLLWVYSSVVVLLVGVMFCNLYSFGLKDEVVPYQAISSKVNMLWFW